MFLCENNFDFIDYFLIHVHAIINSWSAKITIISLRMRIFAPQKGYFYQKQILFIFFLDCFRFIAYIWRQNEAQPWLNVCLISLFTFFYE